MCDNEAVPANLDLVVQPAAPRDGCSFVEASQTVHTRSRSLHHELVRVVHGREECWLIDVVGRLAPEGYLWLKSRKKKMVAVLRLIY